MKGEWPRQICVQAITHAHLEITSHWVFDSRDNLALSVWLKTDGSWIRVVGTLAHLTTNRSVPRFWSPAYFAILSWFQCVLRLLRAVPYHRERFLAEPALVLRWVDAKRDWVKEYVLARYFILISWMVDLPLILLNPFNPESDQCQISPAASQEIWHHTVWRTWLFIAYSYEIWL